MTNGRTLAVLRKRIVKKFVDLRFSRVIDLPVSCSPACLSDFTDTRYKLACICYARKMNITNKCKSK